MLLARVLLDLGQTDRSMDQFQMVLRSDSLHVEALMGLSEVLARIRDRATALSLAKSEHMIEARNIVEPEISALAALRATEGDIRSLEATIEVLAESSATNEECARADVAFHSGLATATGNPLLQALLVSLNEVVYEVCLKGYKEHPKARQRVRGYHMAILSSVKEVDWWD